MRALLLVLFLAGSPCGVSGPLAVTHSADYGPYGGDGASFSLKLDWEVQGEATLSSHRWIVPNGEYRGRLSAEDREALYCLVARVRSTSTSPPSFWICPHSPDFEVRVLATTADSGFHTNACVGSVAKSPLAEIFDRVHGAVRRASWSEFFPGPPDSEGRPSGLLLPYLPRGRSLKAFQ
jgi:hypothetical protein